MSLAALVSEKYWLHGMSYEVLPHLFYEFEDWYYLFFKYLMEFSEVIWACAFFSVGSTH